MDQVWRQFLVTKKVVVGLLPESLEDFRRGLVVDAKVYKLHQNAFFDNTDVFRRENVGPTNAETQLKILTSVYSRIVRY